MEPATEKDIWENFIRYRPDLAEKIGDLCGIMRNLETDDLYAPLCAASTT